MKGERRTALAAYHQTKESGRVVIVLCWSSGWNSFVLARFLQPALFLWSHSAQGRASSISLAARAHNANPAAVCARIKSPPPDPPTWCSRQLHLICFSSRPRIHKCAATFSTAAICCVIKIENLVALRPYKSSVTARKKAPRLGKLQTAALLVFCGGRVRALFASGRN